MYGLRGVSGAGVKACGGDGEDSGKHEYCLMALEYLLERAHAYSAASEAVRWGWCRFANLHSPSWKMEIVE